MKNRYYFVSKEKLKNNIIKPRIPINRLTLSGREDNKTRRICVSKSILGCLHSTEIYANRKRIYLYYCEVNPENIIQPTSAQVSDAKFTGEEWIVVDTEMILVTVLHVTKEYISDEYIKYTIKDKDSAGFYHLDIITHK